MANRYKTLTIAGSDSSGGAGIQADLKTFQERGVYGMSALTTIVAMDPDHNWNHQVFPIPIDVLRAQLKTILQGIGVHAIKTGMLGSVEIIETAAEAIRSQQVPAVIDPVMVCKGTDEVLHPELADALRDILVPLATVTTPNLFEAGQLSKMHPLKTIADMKEAAARIHDLGAKVVIVKGGSKLDHDKAVDVLYDGREFRVLEEERIDTPYIHGAGCTFSAAITAELAKGKPVAEAIGVAKEFITEAIRGGFALNQYVGPVLHMGYRLRKGNDVK
ncbi:MAG: bifunctional hydroxymethylpyrimidine kinase/phosphomethylpyrimidine kinase [Thermoactinomyces sp.]